MIAWLQAKVWQVGTGVATATAFVLAISLAVTSANLKAAKADLRDVQAEITAPGTGWAARLSTCKSNAVALKGRLDEQSKAVGDLGKASARKIAEAEQGLSLARRDAAKAEAKVAGLMRPLVGADTCLRVIEADERLMESLKP